MQFYSFNPRKFKFETHNLEPLERLVYRELIDEYMVFEKPLTTNLDDLAWRMGYKTDELKNALALVLDKFFVIKTLKKTGDKEPMYHHPRLDGVLFDYWKNGGNKDKTTNTTNETTNQSTNDLQTTTNQSTNKNSTDAKKAFLIESLKNQGIKANTRMKIGELQTLFDTHCKAGTNTTNESTNATSPVLAGDNHKPETNNHKPETKESKSNAPTPFEKNQTPPDVEQTQSVADVAHTTETKKSKSAKPPKFDAKTYPIGDSVDNELWCDFVDMRLLIKKPLTENACKQFAKDFENWANDGLSPNLAIAESIKNSWQGVFRDRAIVKIDRPQQPYQPNYQPPSRMDELRELAKNAPVNEFGDFPFANQTNFYQPTAIGANYE